MKNLLKLSTMALILNSCGDESQQPITVEQATEQKQTVLKLNNPDCIDPDLNKVANTTSLMLCNGAIASGLFVVPANLNAENLVAENIKKDITIAGVTGSYAPEVQIVKEEVEKIVTEVVEKIVTNTVEVPVEKIVTEVVEKIVEVEKIVTVTNTVTNTVIETVTVEVPAEVTINPYDLRAGVTVGDVTGKLKASCRNTGNKGTLNYTKDFLSTLTTLPTTVSGHMVDTSFTVEWFDTLEDSPGTMYQSFPAALSHYSIVNGWSNDNYCDESGWEVIVPEDSIASDENDCRTNDSTCLVKDKQSNLYWTNKTTAKEVTVSGMYDTRLRWAEAIMYCDGLTRYGYSDWRLPTQKEAMQAYVNGINYVSEIEMPKEGYSQSDYPTAFIYNLLNTKFWTGTTFSNPGVEMGYVYQSGYMFSSNLTTYSASNTYNSAFVMQYKTGLLTQESKAQKHHVMCVRSDI